MWSVTSDAEKVTPRQPSTNMPRMRLEARPKHCCSGVRLLTLDGRPIGEIRGVGGRIRRERAEIRLTGRQRWDMVVDGSLGGRVVLQDRATERILGSADRDGLIFAAWDLDLSIGRARLQWISGWRSRYTVSAGGRDVAGVAWVGMIGGWGVDGDGLILRDLLLVGLVFEVITDRQRRRAS